MNGGEDFEVSMSVLTPRDTARIVELKRKQRLTLVRDLTGLADIPESERALIEKDNETALGLQLGNAILGMILRRVDPNAGTDEEILDRLTTQEHQQLMRELGDSAPKAEGSVEAKNPA